ncbi:oligoribonuclease [Asbolus verrucosus]|uniref:Probable oligoribonuclease n=1 Tax=Asbolus verrucosus TaxID=1661398 RepID=A0A482V8A7_ASBVE|nr:oligoribonuclease [Asbolus verrucosus]
MLRNVVNNVKRGLKGSKSSMGEHSVEIRKLFTSLFILAQISNYCSGNKTQNFDLEVNRMVWVDMEMTGLDIQTDKIMEVACIVTDSNLNIIAEGPNIVIHHPRNVLDNMSEWCKKQHAKTGLTEACLNSNVTLNEAENKLMAFVTKYVTENVSPLAGNSVYMDRLFLRKYMPRLDEYLHYRIIDVSTIKELCRRWNPNLYRDIPKKEFSHRALADIRESIDELKYYKNTFFKIE